MSPRRHLASVAAQLGPDELRVLTLIAERLLLGKRAYGPLRLNQDGRGWRREATEELLDATVYLSIDCLRREGT